MLELENEELLFIDGGIDWGLIVAGTSLVIACVGVAAAAPVGLPVLAAGALCAASGLGGAAIGTGIVSE